MSHSSRFLVDWDEITVEDLMGEEESIVLIICGAGQRFLRDGRICAGEIGHARHEWQSCCSWSPPMQAEPYCLAATARR